MNFLKMTASPHMHGPETTRGIMLDVLIALAPATLWGAYVFGTRALTVCLVSIVSAVLTEYIYRKIARKNNTCGDLSAAVTGLLLALTLPVDVPLWVCVLGSVFAIAVVKQLFGGIGKNIVNPALAARAFLFYSFPNYIGKFPPFGTTFSLFSPSRTVDAVAAATPLGAVIKGDELSYSISELFFGWQPGTIGEVSEALLLLGGLYLLARKVITWHIPVSYIGTVALLTVLFPKGAGSPLEFMLCELCTGGLFLGAIFMATDYVTSPATGKGRLIFGVGCGLITVFIRYFGGYPEGVSFAIMIMNMLVWYIDMFTKPRAFGSVKPKKGATAK